MREFTEQELNAVVQAEAQLRAQGLIVDDSGGKEEADHNSERISAFFELNKNVPVTVESVLAAAQQMKDQMKWKSALQMQYDAEYSKLDKSQQDQFGAWWFSQKDVLILEGDEGYSNAAHVLQWSKGRTFDASTFNLAVSNLTATQGLHLAPPREQVSSGRPGHADDGKGFMPKDQVNISSREAAARRATAAAGKPTPAPQSTDYRALADSVKGATHSKTEQIQKMFTTRPGTSDIDYEQTYYARRRAAGL